MTKPYCPLCQQKSVVASLPGHVVCQTDDCSYYADEQSHQDNLARLRYLIEKALALHEGGQSLTQILKALNIE